MAIRITEDGVVNYENSPDVNRKLFPNLNICGKAIDELSEEIDGKAPAVFSTASGTIASFDNGADDMPLKSCIVSFGPTQEGEGDPSPENVRPISGRTGLNVMRMGKNLLDPSLFIDQTPWNIIPVKVKPDTMYTMSTDKPSNNLSIYFNNIYTAGGTNANLVYSSHSVTITSSSDGYVYVSQRRASGEDSFQNYNYQIEEGSTATDYEPYKGSTYSVNWESEAGIIYGGSLNVVSGKLVVNREMVDLGLIPWTKNQTYSGLFNGSLVKSATRVTTPRHICSIFIPVDSTDVISLNNSIAISASGTTIYAHDDTYETAADFKTAMSGAQLVYALANPIEYQLAPQEIHTLLGENNIWSDAGDISVEFPADTKTYIDELSIKTVEVSGQTPTITAEENTRYICGEVTSLSFTPSEKGICDVRFTAASISTVLTLPETVKLPDWFDPTLLESGTTYEINIVDDIYGVVMSWA